MARQGGVEIEFMCQDGMCQSLECLPIGGKYFSYILRRICVPKRGIRVPTSYFYTPSLTVSTNSNFRYCQALKIYEKIFPLIGTLFGGLHTATVETQILLSGHHFHIVKKLTPQFQLYF